MYQDRKLVCRDCEREFVFTASEQEFFAEKGFTNDPSRCPSCRAARKQRNGASLRPNRGDRPMYDAVCAECGMETQVPFQPSSDRPVYCHDCYSKKRSRY